MFGKREFKSQHENQIQQEMDVRFGPGRGFCEGNFVQTGS